MKKVLDSWAMLAWLQNEKPASEYIHNLIEPARKGEIKLLINIINFGEVYYRLLRENGENIADLFWNDFDRFPIKLVGVSKSLALIVAKLKGKYRISYADAFAVATAITNECPILTGDPEFQRVSTLVDIEWLKRQDGGG
ncbi:MAG: uncharacterized protein QG588_1418 [Candidatus Poribacteria bacterium]|nr:uncharacterized protein [Candidatus Poribacteria bacterium]